MGYKCLLVYFFIQILQIAKIVRRFPLYTDEDFKIFFGKTDVAEDIQDSVAFKVENLIMELETCAKDLAKANLNEYMVPILEILTAVYQAQNNIKGLIQVHTMFSKNVFEVFFFFFLSMFNL
jgi:hypothetical protein